MTNHGSKTSAEKPLLGAQLCCTSISPEIRSQLAEWAQEMGADHTLDLTSDVTHLLVGGTNSAKYQYVAREREDVKVLLPQYVQALRELWMNDQPIDLNALEARYKCPTLYGLKICITGFEDLDFRNELAKNIVKNGGTYTGDLTKEVTHLIAFTPEGKKYEYAQMWKLKIVSLKWYKDTLDRGMQLNEVLYHPATLPEHQGIGAWNRHAPGSARVGKRQRKDQPDPELGRKLRRTASAKFGSQQNDVWNDIVGQRDIDTPETVRPELLPSKAVPEVKSDLGVDDGKATEGRPQLHMQHDLPNPNRVTETGILAGKHFAIKGFDNRKREVLYGTLSSHGAKVYDTLDNLKNEVEVHTDSCFLIVPLEVPRSRLIRFEHSCSNVTIVTELWLEWCMTSNVFVPPEHYALGLPVTAIDVPAGCKLVVNATGFHQRQTLHISKIIQKLGLVYQQNFTQDTTVLVCNSANPNRQKIEHAQAWGMPVVSEKWLWQLVRNGRIPSYKPFSLVQTIQDVPAKSARGADRESSSHNKKQTEHTSLRTVDQQGSEHAEQDSFLEAARHIQSRRSVQRTTRLDSEHMGSDETPRNTKPDARDEPRRLSRAESVIVKAKDQPMTVPLQQVPSNVQSKRASPIKKKLFRTFDGNSSDHVETRPNSQHQAKTKVADAQVQQHDDNGLDLDVADDTVGAIVLPAHAEKKDHSALLNEFFEVKAAAEARKRAEAAANSARPTSRASNKKKLLGRASSNLSNSSRTSNDNKQEASRNEKQSISRANSINSVNTDGLGVSLSAMSRIPSGLQNNDQVQEQQKRTLYGNAPLVRDSLGLTSNLPQPPANMSVNGMTALDFHAALTTLSTSQPPRPPSPTQLPQLTYADSSQAMALKAHLAEKRRKRAKLGQKEGDPEPELSREESEEMRQQAYREAQSNATAGVVKDDETIVGAGRRTRGRQKALSNMLDGQDEGMAVGTGNVF